MDIKAIVKQYIEEDLLQGRSVVIENETALISGGYIDSITTLQLIDYLEKTFEFEVEAHEVDSENLDSLVRIEAFINTKK